MDRTWRDVVRVVVGFGLFFAVAGASQAPVVAHGGSAAYLLIPAEQVIPGESFEVIAGDFGVNATVAFRIQRDELVVPLSSVTAGPDGHFTSNLALPTDFPGGYVQLVAESSDGTQTSTWILVGPGSSATRPPPGQAAWWTDPSVMVLGVALAGGLGALGYALIRRRQQERGPVVAAGARRRSIGKAQRRAAKRGTS